MGGNYQLLLQHWLILLMISDARDTILLVALQALKPESMLSSCSQAAASLTTLQLLRLATDQPLSGPVASRLRDAVQQSGRQLQGAPEFSQAYLGWTLLMAGELEHHTKVCPPLSSFVCLAGLTLHRKQHQIRLLLQASKPHAEFYLLLCTQQLAACQQAGTEQLPSCRPALQLLLQLRHHCSAELLTGLVPYLQALLACSEASPLHHQPVRRHRICSPIIA